MKIIHPSIFASVALSFSLTAEELPFADYDFNQAQVDEIEEAEKELFLGFEAVTGFRTSYLYRGIERAENTLDFQAHGFYSRSEHLHFEYGAWYAAEEGSGDFKEYGFLLNYIEERGDFTFYLGAKHTETSNFIFNSVTEINYSSTYNFNADNQLTLLASYETNHEHIYGELTYNGFYDLNKNSYLSYTLGVGSYLDYFDTGSLTHGFGRFSYTYNLTEQVSVTPFAGFNLAEDDDTFYGGIWFETSF
ncbi:hypothetical protein OAB00_02615 [Akkermansiaceae bacterium]|nr:hypothetical protein [Akkermansiaceae bacterium]